MIGVAEILVQSSLFGGVTSGDVLIVTPILPDSFDSTSTFRFVVILAVALVAMVAVAVVVMAMVVVDADAVDVAALE